MRGKVRAPAILLIPMLTLSCSVTSREAAFDELARNVHERTGHKVQWNQGSEVDEQVAAELKTLLQSELSAEKAIQIALLNNRELQATYEELSIAQADLVAAGLLTNPVFSVEAKFPEGGGGTKLDLSVVQRFLDIFFIPLQRQIAGAAFEPAKLRVAGDVIELAGEARVTFYSLQAAMQELEMRQKVIAGAEASYFVAKRLRTAGNITELDLQNERAFYEQTKLDVSALELDIVRGREQLNTLMGLWGENTGWKLENRLPELPAEELPAESIESAAVKKSLDLAIARAELEQTFQGVGLARPLSMFTENELGVAAEHETGGVWEVGPALSLPIPIFDFGTPALTKARAALRRVSERYRATAVEVRSRARTSYAAVRLTKEQANYYRQVMLPIREKIVSEAMLQYNAMQIGPFQVLQAKRDQVETGAMYIRALRSYWLARGELDQLLSGKMAKARAMSFEDDSNVETISKKESH